MKKSGLVLGAALAMLSLPAFAQSQLSEAWDLARACAGDVMRFCAGVMPGGGRIKACMKENMAQLSPSCREAFEAFEGKQGADQGAPAAADSAPSAKPN